MYRITFIREKVDLQVPAGVTVLEAERKAGLVPDAPCGGQGKCGKCKVKIDGGMVLACQTQIDRDMEVDTLQGNSKYEILTEGTKRPVVLQPDLRQKKVTIEKPKAGDNRSDWERLITQIDVKETVKADLDMAASLYECRKKDADWHVIYTDDEILELSPEKKKLYFAAFDIGTTTVVGYLLDAETGQELALKSRMNPQTQYGADVIMRANYALENTVQPLKDSIQNALDEMLSELAQEVGIHKNDIYQIAVVGNTCMHHLFLGISPASLVHAPYTPAIRQSLVLRASGVWTSCPSESTAAAPSGHCGICGRGYLRMYSCAAAGS